MIVHPFTPIQAGYTYELSPEDTSAIADQLAQAKDDRELYSHLARPPGLPTVVELATQAVSHSHALVPL